MLNIEQQILNSLLGGYLCLLVARRRVIFRGTSLKCGIMCIILRHGAESLVLFWRNLVKFRELKDLFLRSLRN